MFSPLIYHRFDADNHGHVSVRTPCKASVACLVDLVIVVVVCLSLSCCLSDDPASLHLSEFARNLFAVASSIGSSPNGDAILFGELIGRDLERS